MKNNIFLNGSNIQDIILSNNEVQIKCKTVYIGNTLIYRKGDGSKIGIMFTDGTIIDYTQIPASATYDKEDVIGISIQNSNMSVIIPPYPISKAYFCNENISCPSAILETGINGASSKYIGEEATAAFRTTLGNVQQWAVNIAYNTTLNGQNCYLPYQGELLVIYRNKDIINELLVKCGYNALPNGDYWSSSLLKRVDSDGNSTNNINGYLKIMAGINFGSNNIWGLNVQGYYNVLPITKLNIS